MANNNLSQQLQYGNETYRFRVYPGVEETHGVPFVLVKNIQMLFPDASTFMCGNRVIDYMCDASYDSLVPLRFAYQPDVITIAEVKPSMTPVEVLPESSPLASRSPRPRQFFSALSSQQLIREDSILHSTSVSLKEKEELQQSTAIYESYVEARKKGLREKADLLFGKFQQCLSELKAPMARSDDLQQQMSEMKQQIDVLTQNQQLMLEKQDFTLDRLAVIQGRVQAILTQTYELHEYPIPRLFIILPKDSSEWNPTNLLNNQFQLFFLCECGQHTKAFNDDNTNIPHHIHIAKHEGYDLQRPKEFFQKYGRYILTLLEMIKYGVTFAGFASPAVAGVSAPGAIDMFQKSLDSISQSAINQSIKYLQSLSSEQEADNDTSTDSFARREALEGADLRHLEVFVKSKDQDRALGNLYRIITEEGHVKWVCIDHYRLAYKEKDQKAFVTAVDLNGGQYDEHLGKVTVSLGSKILAAGFFDALAKARGVVELIVTFDWEGTTSDLETFGDTLKSTAVSILQLDLGRFRTSFTSKFQSTYTRQHALAGCINLPRMKMIHIILPMDLFELSNFQPKKPSCPPKLSFEVVSRQEGFEELGKRRLKRLVETLKTSSTLKTLDLTDKLIGDNGAVALSEALKTNSALTTLDMTNNSIGENGAVALSEALKANSSLTTLNLTNSSIRENGAVALSKALKTNSTLTTLDLWSNTIGENGAVALSKALKTNSTLTTLDLWSNTIGENGAVALSKVLKTNSTLTTLDLASNSLGNNGAVALSEALKTNSTLITLDLRNNSISDNGAVALFEALNTNSTLTTVDLSFNSIGGNGAVALSKALKPNSTLTTLDLRNNLFSQNGAEALSEALKTNSSLTTLDLSFNSIGCNGAVALSEALKTNSTLTTLNLWRNRIGDNGAVALSEALKVNSTLATLDLKHSSIGAKGDVALAEALNTNSTVIVTR